MDNNNVFDSKINKARITQAEKNANDFQWYKDYSDRIGSHAIADNFFAFTDNMYNGRKANYDLFNNIINIRDLQYVCKPFGDMGNMPARFENRDITSGKIKVLLGMEMSMPFAWKILAINEEATTRKEQEETSRIKDFVINEIMRPIKLQIEKQAQEQSKGKQLTPEEQQKIQDEIAQETQAKTPDEVRKYMVREHQDPAERMHSQLLKYLIQRQNMGYKFNKGFKHLALGAKEVYNIAIFNGEPIVTVVNVLKFVHDRSPEIDFIEDSEWAECRYSMTASEVLSKFSKYLTDEQIDKIYSYDNNKGAATVSMNDYTFDFEGNANAFTMEVSHRNWKSLQKIGFLTYIDKKGKEQLKLVDENYQLNEDIGDIDIQWEWIPEAHECYKILDDIYVCCRPVEGQNRDLDNLYDCKLSYYGACCDDLNSIPTCPMDRIKHYQYLYDIIIYRIELLMASDKGKILALNINAIPKSSGIDIAKWQYFFEANHLAWLNPKEEGNRGSGDIVNMVKEIDMSLASNIQHYIEFAEYIERKCGTAIGITPQMEAQIGPNEAVTNTQQNIQQASHIIRPYFELHNMVKGNVLKGLVECGKVAYRGAKQTKLSYFLDDMSVEMFTIDQGMLDSTTIGLFIGNSSKAAEAKQAIVNLGQAAMQNQQIDLGDMVKILKSDDINEAGEQLDASQLRKQEQLQAGDKAKQAQEKEAELRADTLKREQWDHEKDMVILKETERRETVLQQATISAMGYDVNKDEDNDGEPDVLEVYKHGLDTEIKRRSLDQKDEMIKLEGDKFTHQKDNDKAKNAIEIKKLNKPSSSK